MSSLSSFASCQEQVNRQVALWQGFVALSVGLTVLTYMLSNICLRRRLHNSPSNTRIFFGSLGCVKIALAVTIFALVPSCPSGCTCSSDLSTNFVFYPFIALMIGVRWIGKAYTTTLEPVEATAVVVGHVEPEAVGYSDDEDDEEQGGAAQMVTVKPVESSSRVGGKTKGDFKAVPTTEEQMVV